jgi:Mn-dependent DtxR family transcriptional regulator
MPPMSSLTESEERILLALWRLKGVGENRVREDSLKADLSAGSSEQPLGDEVARLQSQGFVETVVMADYRAISLTSLGLAILRQIEEDKLQELK